ncbi:MAG: response regulator [Chromatiales bacterium]|nr:response regulator [Chromatiales bacterium]
MGGEMGVESEPGPGLDVLVHPQRRPRPERPRARVLAAPPRPGSGVRVLIVDDNATNREILQPCSWAAGAWRRRLAASGAAGARPAAPGGAGRRAPIALAILDWHMPEMDGLELARQIRADSTLSSLRSADAHLQRP